MKRCRLLIILMMVSWSTFSQGLKPTVQRTGNDTLICFTIDQSKQLAKMILKGSYSDSLVTRLETENELLNQIVETKDSSIQVLKAKVQTCDTISTNQEQIMAMQAESIRAKDRLVRKERNQKKLLGVLLAVVTVLAIL